MRGEEWWGEGCRCQRGAWIFEVVARPGGPNTHLEEEEEAAGEEEEAAGRTVTVQPRATPCTAEKHLSARRRRAAGERVTWAARRARQPTAAATLAPEACGGEGESWLRGEGWGIQARRHALLPGGGRRTAPP